MTSEEIDATSTQIFDTRIFALLYDETWLSVKMSKEMLSNQLLPTALDPLWLYKDLYM